MLKRKKAIIRWFRLIIGWIFVVVGVILIPLPIPAGALIAVVGLALLLPENKFLHNKLCLLRKRYQGLNKPLRKLAPHLPEYLRHGIEVTDPEHTGCLRGQSERA